MSISLWALLFLIGVYDAKEHRIPNVLLCLMIFVAALDYFSMADSSSLFFQQITTMAIIFVCSLCFYLVGGMASGDVKLLAVIAFVTSSDHVLAIFFWIAVAAVVIGLMYRSLNRLRLEQRASVSKLSKSGNIRNKPNLRTSCIASSALVVMPFAPVVVCGVALAQHANYAI